MTKDDYIDIATGTAQTALGAYSLGEIQSLLDRLRTQISEGTGTIGQQAADSMQFRPYTVTSGLGTFTTDESGGLNFALSDEARAQQQARFDQAETLFGRAMADPTRATATLYEDIRAIQRPEEQRMQQGLNQGLFSSGRGGISSAEFGGTREEFMSEKARAEAMNAAALQARGMVQQQQQQDFATAQGLMGLGYMPQQQALGLFQQSQIPAQLAQQAQLGGAELQSQIGLTGLEGLMGLGQAEAEAAASLFAGIIQGLGGLYSGGN
jgi:hypothetical protein